MNPLKGVSQKLWNDFQVGPWLVQPSLNTISQNGTSTRVEPKVMGVLVTGDYSCQLHSLVPDVVDAVNLVCLILPNQELDLVSQLLNPVQDGVPVHAERIRLTGFRLEGCATSKTDCQNPAEQAAHAASFSLSPSLARPIHHKILATIRQPAEEIAMESYSRFSGTSTSVPSKRCNLDTIKPCSL